MSIDEKTLIRSRSVTDLCSGLYREGRYVEAEDLAREGLVNSPDDGTLWQMLGLLHFQMGRHSVACGALETAALLVPLSPQARCALAESYARLGRPGLAVGLYRHLAEDEKCPTELLPAVASGLGSIGDDEAALGACRTLIGRDPSRHEAHFGAAYYLRRLGRPIEEALPLMTRAHDLAPAVPLYRVALASMVMHLGETDEAYDLLRGVDPKSIGCRCCLSRMMNIFLRAGDIARFAACKTQGDHLDTSADETLS